MRLIEIPRSWEERKFERELEGLVARVRVTETLHREKKREGERKGRRKKRMGIAFYIEKGKDIDRSICQLESLFHSLSYQ